MSVGGVAKPTVLSLFSGIGGLELGLERAGMTTVGQVELDPYCRRVLAKHWPDVPRHDDVRTAVEWWQSTERPRVDVICGGFPCQDISNAGRRAGIIDGERSSLWAFMADVVRRVRPRYVVMENVSAILVRGLDVVAADLAALGYDLQWDCVPAAAVGAYHRRDRWFGIAYAHSNEYEVRSHAVRWPATAELPADAEGERCRQGRPGGSVGGGEDGAGQWPEVLADDPEGFPVRPRLRPDGAGWLGWRRPGYSSSAREFWASEPDVGRVAYGVPSGVDRLRALGNAVVPQVAEHVGRLIMNHIASLDASLGVGV